MDRDAYSIYTYEAIYVLKQALDRHIKRGKDKNLFFDEVQAITL